MPLTTAQAAELCSLTQSAFRGAMTRERAAGRDYRLPGPDARTPLWDGEKLAVWLAGRKQR